MIKVENLTKQFGTFTAVNKVSFEVEKGEIFGLLGENGAGKTTTLRMLATMLKPTSGTASMAGFDIISQPEKVRTKIGILFGGETGLYDRLTCEENIAYFGMLNDMSRDRINDRIKALAKAFGMEEYIRKRAGKLSKGMKQKVAFARAIIHDPDIMLFDEPTSGLDVSAIKDVHDFIRICKNEGKTIVFSSHTMSEVEKLCDKIAIINKGELIEKGKVKEIKQKYGCDSLEDIFIQLVGDKNES
ncbi:ATP-binding cassette domain-containing protein [Acetivibrio clariflavus]|uniref:ABC-type Na+ transport system, ATPase component n=1 Tax=Acetivibrio clariflavus (strain DSM 19732 / NBRC 101661 / EBR45) TaxID=720554 RepID=G8LTT4_ACECE|nr:ATP-binding cassette domain-containing protein [Acetivibrio clariflavus]AEV67280.1 ABC-type Na+ transport system, ATPase component [Acetivibrio clariflavus DSM 19732]